MHRQPLLRTLQQYAAAHPGEAECAAQIESLVRRHVRCFERDCLPGHITASAWIVSADHRHCLLTHHRKLDRWLQLGGHADGDADVLRVALREAREESGMAQFTALAGGAQPAGRPGERQDDRLPLPIDVDVHTIPARPGEPAHEHHDVRFLLVAAPGQRLAISDESNDLAWFEWDRLGSVGADESLLRLARKARRRLAEASAIGIGG